MGQPVRGLRFHRQEAAEKLVLPLRAAFESLQLARDGEVDRLVVAGLEVQQGHVFEGAPVAAIQRVGGMQVERAADGFSFALGKDQQGVLRHGFADPLEELQVQIRRRLVHPVGVAIAPVEELPVLRADLCPGQVPEGHAGLADLPALLLEVLPFLVRHAREEVVEIRVPVVSPVELHRASHQHALAVHQCGLALRREQDVEGRHALREVEGLADQEFAIRIIACQHARAGDGREGHRAEQLGVVLQPVARVRVSPRPVEDVLAVGVGLQEHRHRPGELIVPLQHEDLRLPAGARRCAACVDQRVEELVAQEGVATAPAVPGRGVDAAEGFENAEADHCGGGACVECGKRTALFRMVRAPGKRRVCGIFDA